MELPDLSIKQQWWLENARISLSANLQVFVLDIVFVSFRRENSLFFFNIHKIPSGKDAKIQNEAAQVFDFYNYY